ncbi:hypothetical protein UVI_02042500 [Ustilaginoidea virens]|uniref:Uncharacterized protein n=1 Tax=Ustilaginoidea virens TaxID=1159556 RepID=A0A1B5L4L9_USTVR|nr:hypothetical protein UVI_02042500 [Ustilaginoidea virens]
MEGWWLGPGFDLLLELVNADHVHVARQDCRFLHAIQARLRAFDNSRDAFDRCAPPAATASWASANSNPRKKLRGALELIFKPADDGGLQQGQALEGLALLQEVEAHRLELIKAAKRAVQSCAKDDGTYHVVDVLNQTTTERYASFQLGFRVLARHSLLKYSVEFEKVEEACLSILNAAEDARSTAERITRAPSLSRTLSPSSDDSRSLEAARDASSSHSGGGGGDAFEQPADASIHSSVRTCAATCSPLDNYYSPLLKGMPGREISAAKTDGAAFAMDFSAPDVLVYPDDLSKEDFDMHPLAKHMDMSGNEMAQLGLLLPKERPSRDF